MGSRSFYLGTAPDPTFATVHVPASHGERSVGVVFCPPFGWEAECSHRIRRAWAQALAAAGHPAVAFDLPGTGDSGGSLDRADLVQSWIQAAGSAACWLREEFSCSRVCALGLGFGGTLAWLAAADGAPIDDLVLWAAPLRGRRLLREVRVSAQLEIDFELHGERREAQAALAPEAGEPGPIVDVAGQILTADTVDALSAVDLRDCPLPDPAQRRALVFQRHGVKADQELATLLRTAGVGVMVDRGDGYDLLMRYVQQSIVPRAVISASIEWLTQMPRSRRGSAFPPGGWRDAWPSTSTETAEMPENGTTIRETPVTIELPSGEIRAVITQPVEVESADLCAVFFSGGSDRRIGPNRMWVDTARRWAAKRVTAVRIDLPGTGDADGDERLLDELQAHYDPAQVVRAGELLDALVLRGLPGRFLMVGFCSGAFRSLHLAVGDERVAGVFAIGLHFFHWRWWSVNVRNSWIAERQPMPEDSSLKLGVLRVLQRGLRVMHKAHHAVVVLGQGFPNRGERMVNRLAARGVELLFILKRTSYAHEQLTMPRRRARLRRIDNLQVRTIPGDDPRFRPAACQRFVSDALDEGVRCLMATDAGTPSATRRERVMA